MIFSGKIFFRALSCGLILTAVPLHAEEEPTTLSRFSTNFRLGVNYEFSQTDRDIINALRPVVGLEFGVALDRQQRATLLLQGLWQPAPANGGQILLGFQYDAPLGVKGLYLSPRLSVGYASVGEAIDGGDFIDVTRFDGFALNPELGITYVFATHVEMMLVPANFSVLMASRSHALNYHAYYSAFVAFSFRWDAGVR